MIYTVEIRGVNETEWKLLKDKVAEKYSGVGFDGVSGRRVPAAGDGVGRAGQSAGRGADVADGERAVPDRQHAAEDHGPGGDAERRQAAGAVARGGRAEQRDARRSTRWTAASGRSWRR